MEAEKPLSKVWKKRQNMLPRFGKNGKTCFQGLEKTAKHASKVWKNGENGFQALEECFERGFTLVEVLVALGLLVSLACLTGGVAAAVRVAETRAAATAGRGRVVASLYVEARMAGSGGRERLEVPGAEGAWAVTGERVGGDEIWRSGFTPDAVPPVPERWRVVARERRAGGGETSLELSAWPEGRP